MGEGQTFDLSQVWALSAVGRPAYLPTRSALQCGLGTAWWFSWQEGTNRQGEEDQEKKPRKTRPAGAARPRQGWGAHSPSALESRLGLDACPRGVLGLLLPETGGPPPKVSVCPGEVCLCSVEGLRLGEGPSPSRRAARRWWRVFGAGVLVDWPWLGTWVHSSGGRGCEKQG